jgi:hypothetical protein
MALAMRIRWLIEWLAETPWAPTAGSSRRSSGRTTTSRRSSQEGGGVQTAQPNQVRISSYELQRIEERIEALSHIVRAMQGQEAVSGGVAGSSTTPAAQSGTNAQSETQQLQSVTEGSESPATGRFRQIDRTLWTVSTYCNVPLTPFTEYACIYSPWAGNLLN